MVNIQGGTKMMVNRCMELLRAKIARAQSRHIAKRAPIARPVLGSLPKEQLAKERMKTKSYQANKRRSMWEQREVDQTEEIEPEIRLDDVHIKDNKVFEREYSRTWNSFPDRPIRRAPIQFNDELPPLRRRRCRNDRPVTAKPWDEEAKDFISQWDTNQAMINRNRYARASDHCPPPTVGKPLAPLRSSLRNKQFYY